MVDSHGKISNWKRNSEFYKIVPLLKELYKQDLLDRENLIAFIQGGDIGVLREFDEIIKTFLKNGLKEFWIVSNNIVYQPIVKKLLDTNRTLFVTTLDCGSREMYKKLNGLINLTIILKISKNIFTTAITKTDFMLNT